MSKILIAFLLTAATAVAAQTQHDPEADTKKTPQQKGYHETKPRNTGPTPPQSKEDQAKDKAAKEKIRSERDGLDTQRPPTRQPELITPPKP